MCLTPRAGCSRVGAATQVSRHILPKGIPGGVCVTWGTSWNPTKYLMGWHCLDKSGQSCSQPSPLSVPSFQAPPHYTPRAPSVFAQKITPWEKPCLSALWKQC